MLTEIYIEALLVDEEAADQVWEAWFSGGISDYVAALGWWTILLLDEKTKSGDALWNSYGY